MTFIASVVAKKGVAIIADSLVTSTSPVLHYQTFLDYLNSQPDNEQGEKSINSDQITNLFNSEPVFTKDFEEKLFKLNKYTAVTTTGIAYINDKSISDLVEEFRRFNIDTIDNIGIQENLENFAGYISGQAKENIEKYLSVGYCVFIFTFYAWDTHKTSIYKMIINQADTTSLAEPNFNYTSLALQPPFAKVVCDGQNKISEKVLHGIGRDLYSIFEPMVNLIIKKLNMPQENVPETFIEELRKEEFFDNIFYGDVALLNLTELSLQQAIDLASLLMRLEVDFQKYTKNIPTVGGVIKLAVIDEEGFRFVSGDAIGVPKHINY